ncbi:hypothetical protein AOQ84DRAFT_27800 [Glonium stellatum]|uniref:Uncharacterized protein n=1 Tax=Glonium stellatum TaxID=574774 RepID=A0A8E2F262_9PEZI|nr:hypothetical protein AOQ84DRAFT_27800 [Glonium stellatum]
MSADRRACGPARRARSAARSSLVRAAWWAAAAVVWDAVGLAAAGKGERVVEVGVEAEAEAVGLGPRAIFRYALGCRWAGCGGGLGKFRSFKGLFFFSRVVFLV